MSTAEQAAGRPSIPAAPNGGMQSGSKVTEAFGAMTVERSAELAAVSVAAGAKAEVEAAYVMAIRNPRRENDARVAILEVCKNPIFARKAKYRKPIGTSAVVGPSIRFAEEALRHWKNVLVQQPMIYDDETKRIVKVMVKDLESNLSYSTEIVVEKTVERRDTRGREVLRERLNSQNQKVAIVRATEDEIQVKQAALVSKAIRNFGLRLIPDHILEEAMQTVDETIKKKVADDPQAERRNLMDSFARFGIRPSDIETAMGCPMEQLTPSQIVELQEVQNSIQDGHTTWSEFVESQKSEKKEPSKGALDDFEPGDSSTHVAVDKPISQAGNDGFDPKTFNEFAEIVQSSDSPDMVKENWRLLTPFMSRLKGTEKGALQKLKDETEAKFSGKLI